MVLGIIALVVGVGLPAIQVVTGQRIQSTTRKLTGMMRSIRNDAILLNLVHRVAINFDDRTWWIENQRKLELLTERDPEADPADQAPSSNFVINDKYTKEPLDWPAGVDFRGILSEAQGFINQGMGYIHFFPNGFAEQSILYLARNGNDTIFYSMVIRPTAGRVEIVPGEVKQF